MVKAFHILLFLAWLVIGPVNPVCADWRGELEWTYLDYKADQGGKSVVDASHFTQRYGLHWQTRGAFYNGRGGAYKLGLGYQWLALDSEVNDESTSLNGGKVTYNGEVLFAPGGLPFRINAFSHDFSLNSLDKVSVRPDGTSLLDNYRIVDPQVAGGILGGTRIESGVTVIAGIKNGTYLGSYRELLSKYPRLLMDFHEQYVRNLDAIVPQHFRQRDLAFVSLNKKNNWFHYRFRDYTNYLDSTDDGYSRQFLIGTVDHLMRREWINLTNWIKISTDLSLTLEKEGLEEKQSTYNFNLFQMMQRNGFTASNFNTFERSVQGDERGTEYEIPVFVRGDLDPNRQYQGMFVNYEEKEISPRRRDNERGSYLKGQLLLGRKERVQHAPGVALEVRRDNRGEGEAAEFEYEVFTNPALHWSVPAWLGRYRAVWVDGTTGEGDNVSTIEQELAGELTMRGLGGWDVRIAQSLLYANDKAPENATRYISLQSNFGGLAGNGAEEGGAYFRSVSDVEGNRTLAAFRHRLKLTYEYERTAETTSLSLLTLRHRLDHEQRLTRLVAESNLLVGDITSYRTITNPIISERRIAEGGQADWSFLHKTSVEYLPSAALIMKGHLVFDWARGEDLDQRGVGVGEEILYRFFPKAGFKRKLAELSQSANYTLISTRSGDWRELKFTLAANWYPLRMLRFGALAAYTAIEPEGDDALEWKLLAGVDFAKLQCEVSYAYGLNRAGDNDTSNGDIREHLIEARVKKIF